MSEPKEITSGIARIVLAIVVLIEGLIVLILIVFISVEVVNYRDKIKAAYADSYDDGYAWTYDTGYQEPYVKANNKGYSKGYKIGLETGSRAGVATRVELYNPTHKEMREFLAGDWTDAKPFISGEYVSFDFAAELNNNAEANGIRAAFVLVIFPERRHGIVAFETIDNGLIFIEPQSDKEARLVIDKPYWPSVGKLRPRDYDDTVVEFQIIW